MGSIWILKSCTTEIKMDKILKNDLLCILSFKQNKLVGFIIGDALSYLKNNFLLQKDMVSLLLYLYIIFLK